MFFINLVVALCLLVSLFISVVAGFGVFVFSFSSYPLFALALIPVLLGLFGTVGLYLAWTPKPSVKSTQRLHTELTLLVAGELGALAFLVVYYTLPLLDDLAQSWRPYIPMVFPLLPMLLGVGLIVRAALALRQLPASGARAWRPAGLVLLACLGLLLLRIGGQEAMMAWYGRDLVGAAYASAESIAGDSGYCVIDRGGARRFEELNRRRLLLDAVHKRLGFRGINTTWVSAHFGIAVEGQAYWWSFRRRQFLSFPRGIDSYLYSRDCPYDY